MLLHLLAAMEEKNITISSLAQLIGTTENNANRKILEIADFSMSEAKKIQEILFPEYDFCYLFSSAENNKE